MIIFLRAETYANDSRVALVPADVAILVGLGHTIYVESSKTRAFYNLEFEAAGAILTDEPWYAQPYTTFIVGLKELTHLDRLNEHTHVYFSHSYKRQAAAPMILGAFARSLSILYDLEYFCNPDGSRFLAFGVYAGMVGAVLGLRQVYNRRLGQADIADLRPWTSYNQMLRFCKPPTFASIAIVGRGRCAKGVRKILDWLGMDYDLLGRMDPVDPTKYDILFNCILLDDSYNRTWVRTDHPLPLLIVDISCDYTKPNNPVPVYKEATSWQTPVHHVSDTLSVIAIDNLPSLLPRESSAEFSKLLADLLLRYGDAMWRENLVTYNEKIRSIV